MNDAITVESIINAPVEKVWEHFNDPGSITQWAFASDEWEAPHAENDLRVGGSFLTRMQAKDGSAGFDFKGTYTDVIEHQEIAYVMDDGIKVLSTFEDLGDGQTKVTTTFDMERENSAEMQREGWQAILNNFKQFVEQH